MKVVNLEVIAKFLKRHRTATRPVTAWLDIVKEKDWTSYAELKNDWSDLNPIDVKADSCRIVFKIGDDWRIDTLTFFPQKLVLVKRIDSHEAYNKWKY